MATGDFEPDQGGFLAPGVRKAGAWVHKVESQAGQWRPPRKHFHMGVRSVFSQPLEFADLKGQSLPALSLLFPHAADCCSTATFWQWPQIASFVKRQVLSSTIVAPVPPSGGGAK